MCVIELGIEIPAGIRNVVVANIWKKDSDWNRNIIILLPTNVLNLLASIPVPTKGYGEDTKFWSRDKHDIFTMFSNYELLLDLGMYRHKFGRSRCRKE
jgi:hypothetical protein